MKDEKLQKVHLEIFILHIGIAALIHFTSVTPRTYAQYSAVTSMSKLVNANTITCMGWLFHCA